MDTKLFKICYDDMLGRHLVATQSIPSGTIILKEAPLIRGPFLHTIPVCLGCGKILNADTSIPCSKCGWPICDESCEKLANHLPECILTVARGSQISIKNFGIPNPNYQFVSILRALFLKKNNPQIWETLMQLQSHPIDVNMAPPGFIRKLFKLDDWSEDEIRKVVEILTVNGHELPLTNPAQLVVYDNTSFLEHCCRANCTKTFTDDGEVLIITAEPVLEGNHLSICYTDPFWGVENRRQHLHESKQFWCSCCRCSDPTDLGIHLNSIKCPNKGCDGLLIPKSFLEDVKLWNCGKCDKTSTGNNISLLLGRIGIELSEMPKGNAAACKQFIKKYENILAPNHFYFIDVQMALTQILSSENIEDLNDGDLMLLLKMTEDLKSIGEKIAPAERRFLGLILYRLAKIEIEIARRGGDRRQFRSVLAISKETLTKARLFLTNEPSLLPEGRIRLQIGLELNLVDDLLLNDE